MQQHYRPAPLEIAENFRFQQRKQNEATHCNFGNNKKTALRNKLVFGLRSAKTLNRLLETKDLTFDRAHICKYGTIVKRCG